MRHFKFALISAVLGAAIIDAGGHVLVTAAADTVKLPLTDKDGQALTNPVAITNGMVDFYVADSVNACDLFIQAPGGQFKVVKNVAPGTMLDAVIDQDRKDQVMVIPFAGSDAGAAEYNTGFAEPAGAIFTPVGAAVTVLTADAGKTIEAGPVGTDAGYVAATSVGAAGTIAAGDGTLLDNAGTPKHAAGTGKNIALLLSAASVAKGYVRIPYSLGY